MSTDTLDEVVRQARIAKRVELNLTLGQRNTLEDALEQYIRKYRGIERRSRGGNGGYVARLAEETLEQVKAERTRIYHEEHGS